nr:uncharacterized protein LOC105850774 [Hydra vulgaris]
MAKYCTNLKKFLLLALYNVSFVPRKARFCSPKTLTNAIKRFSICCQYALRRSVESSTSNQQYDLRLREIINNCSNGDEYEKKHFTIDNIKAYLHGKELQRKVSLTPSMVFPSQPDDFKKHISPTCSNICNASFSDIHESHAASEVVTSENQVLNPTCSNICNASFADIHKSHTASEVVTSENQVLNPTCSNICNASFTDIHQSHTASEVVTSENQVLNPTCSNICNASFADIHKSHTASEVVTFENQVLKYLENGYESMLNLKRAAYV